jgi:NAD(P)-dependent dehydrogenase (short-subunit alcohol dehydrogenase family)
MPRHLDGNVAVVTGGGSPHGIGAAKGKLVAQRGCRGVLSDVNRDTLDATVKDLNDQGLDVAGALADVADFDSVHNLADTVFTQFGKVDIAFLNVGIGSGGSYFDAEDVTNWRQVFDVNFFGILHGIKAFVSRMIQQNSPGDVIATTSSAGTVGVMYETPAFPAARPPC